MATHTYIALLRGINVSGQKIIKMEALRAAFAGLGFSDVQTYVQSGNVLFKSPNTAETVLVKKISQRILDDFGHAVEVLVRTPEELSQILKANPWLKQPGAEAARWYVTFLAAPAPKDAGDLLKPLAAAGEQFLVRGREIYLCCPNGYGNTKFSNNAIEKKLSLPATTRNWRTVSTLFELAQT